MDEASEINEENINKKTNKLKINSDYILKKTTPPSFPRRKKDIYVSNKSSIEAQIKKCEKLFDSGETELVIHGLGAAQYRAYELALKLQSIHQGTLGLDVRTGTVQLTDNLEPLTDEGDYKLNSRFNSSTHIRVFRTVLVGPFKYSS
ncbi:ribonuclease P protein subunit p20 [Microplitis mediator]|uniref:ribonuclease P protein subunit p20 n=1 Tax=Microplitis mediator TaxID=375433 RepID=UPI0025540FF2|nr:ribonuclease P protein subunit p20 [Microplitis mediator]